MEKPTHVPYDPEFRARAVELVRTRGLSRSQVARDLGINPETLRLWVKQAEVDAGQRDGLTTDEKAELVRLRRENRILREEREILKKAARFFGRREKAPGSGGLSLDQRQHRPLHPVALPPAVQHQGA